MESSMNIRLISCLLLVTSLSLEGSAGLECDPITPGCRCSLGTLECSGKRVDKFPTLNVPNDIEVYTFTDCSLNVITEVPYVNATEVRIQNCGVVRISDTAFSNLTRLQALSINDNHLKNLSLLTISNLTRLTKLELRDNGLVELPDGIFDKMINLKHLDLSENFLQLKDTLFGEYLPQLTTLLCEDCHLTEVPKVPLARQTALLELNLNKNNFTRLFKNELASLGTVQSLSLDNCNIQSIEPEAFKHLKSIVTLNLGNNKITSLPPQAFQYFRSTLRSLYLEGNSLTTLSEEMVVWSNLTNLRLEKNPWHCDASLAWVNSYELQKIHKENVTCHSPSDIYGKNLFVVYKNNLYSKGGTMKAVLLGISIPIIIVCLGLIVYNIRQMMRNKRQQETLRRSSFKYRSVYGDTVESNSKQSIMT